MKDDLRKMKKALSDDVNINLINLISGGNSFKKNASVF